MSFADRLGMSGPGLTALCGCRSPRFLMLVLRRQAREDSLVQSPRCQTTIRPGSDQWKYGTLGQEAQIADFSINWE